MSAIDEYRRAMEASGVPSEPLAVYDSNSYRRVGLASTYREVMWPDKHPYDGHPDISGEKVLRALVAAFNAMLEHADSASHSLHPDTAGAECSIGDALTRPFRETVEARAARDPEFAKALADSAEPAQWRCGLCKDRGWYDTLGDGMRQCGCDAGHRHAVTVDVGK